MPQSVKIIVLVGLVAVVSACSKAPYEPETAIVDAPPVSVEPTYTGKYN